MAEKWIMAADCAGVLCPFSHAPHRIGTAWAVAPWAVMQARARPWWHGRVLHRGWNRTDMGGCAGMAEAVLTWPAVLAWADPRRHDRLCWCGRGPHWHERMC